jgi:stage II sporulation protein D
MKQIRIGLTGPDLLSLRHREVDLHGDDSVAIFVADQDWHKASSDRVKPIATAQAGTRISISAIGDVLKFGALHVDPDRPQKVVIVRSLSSSHPLFVGLSGHASGASKSYLQPIIIEADGDCVRAFVQSDLDNYTQAVLQSEIPDSFHIEAIKAQAIAARTYALNPRIDHSSDHCHVCDSYLCCQAFAGKLPPPNSKHAQAVAETKGQVMVYQDKPILALFSSSAGGHTENYESCFSDLLTNAFPAAPLPYLRGVSEARLRQDCFSLSTEQAVKDLFQSKEPKTIDALAPQFKWSVRLSNETLDAYMHHAVETLLAKSDMAPFVIPPQSQIFGSVESLSVEKRGVGGTAITLAIKTSKGTWQFKKELVIRSVFKNSEAKINRLKSARLYFEHERDEKGRLLFLSIHGLGFGHGVGMQQTGAQGWAHLAGKNCRQILDHYFAGIQIAQI